ncbi:hypothetical protein K438DRAFT_2020103 [Mycena galopus ATCC 62051]|nr:hypothetical protein K438DRAFT_2020103 [Mycena galopus ATCC 62051]
MACSQSPHGHYVPLLKIVLAWVSALVLASGHHAFYASLDNHPVTSGTTASLFVHSQAWASAIGTAFAFLVSSLLAVSAGTAFLQCAWRVARKRAVSISGLNAMWSSLTNVFAFLSLDFWRTAQGIVIVSALAWTFPLIVTFAPGTLTIESDVTTVSGPCQVPIFDWEATELLYDLIDSGPEFYFSRSSLTEQIVGATVLGGQPLPATSPCGRNCSYLVSTNGPSYSCSVGAQNPSALNWTSALLQADWFPPPPYFADQTDITAPSTETPFGDWDFQAHYTNYTDGDPDDSGHNITCIAYNSTYNVNYTFAGTTASVVIENIIPQQLAGQMSPNISVQARAPGQPTSLPHTAWYNATASYSAIFSSIASYAIGSVTVQTRPVIYFVYSSDTLRLGQTQMMETTSTVLFYGVADKFTWIPIEDIPPIFESLLQNITLSILGGAADRSQSMNTTCIYSHDSTQFVYNKRRLWLIYGLGLGVALLCDFFGIIAFFQNQAFGGATGSNFGAFLAATRNPELNELNLNDPGRIRLVYGPVLSEGGRYAFGRPDALAVGGKESSLLGSM